MWINNLLIGTGMGLLAVVVVFILAILSGVFVWLLYPYVVNAVLPGVVASGAIAAKLTIWQSIGLAWLCSILFKGSGSSSSSSK